MHIMKLAIILKKYVDIDSPKKLTKARALLKEAGIEYIDYGWKLAKQYETKADLEAAFKRAGVF